jgi:hypothetical protein
MVLILVLVIYGGKVPLIIAARKENIKIREQAEKIAELEFKLEMDKIKRDGKADETTTTAAAA